MSIRLTKIFVGLMMAVMIFASSPAQAASLTSAQVDAIISLLQSFGADASTIANVQASLTGGTPSTPTTPTTGTGYTFTALLKLGSTGTEVMNLQKVLNMSADTQVSTSGAGAPGSESSYFGTKTKAAVIKFQAKNGLVADGIVGANTRAKLNAMSGGTSGGGVVVPVGGGVAVSSPAQPTTQVAVGSGARVPFTKVTLTAGSSGATINGIKVERAGLAVDAVFSGVVLLDENGLQLGTAKTFNSLHQATVGEMFTLAPGQSRTFTIAGNMASSLATYAGQVAYLSVVGVDTTATVSGTFPVTGAGVVINGTLSIGTATVARGATDPVNSTTVTKAVGTTGYTFSAVKVTAGSAEKIRIKSIRWNQSGSASASDLGNVMTYVDGVAYAASVSADGKYYTTTFGDGIVVDKGLSKELAVKGDILAGSGRTVDFDIYKTTDLYITGETYGYGITPSATAGTNCTTTSCDDSEFQTIDPWYDASQVSVGTGSLVVSNSSVVAAGKIANGGTGQSLASFVFDVTGEPITFTQIVLTVATNTGSAGELLSNVGLYNSSGAVIAGPQDPNAAGSSITFTDTVTLPVGKNVVTVKGNLNTGWETNDTIRLNFTPSSALSNVKGATTDQTITPSPSSIIYGNTQTVSSGALTVSPSTSLTTANVVNGTTGAVLGRFVLDASASGEDIRVSTVQVKGVTGANADLDELNSLQLMDGTTALNTGSNVYNPSGNAGAADATLTITLDGNGYTVTKGTTKVVDLIANVNASSTPTSDTTYRFHVDSLDWGVTGATTGQTIVESLVGGASAGATMTIVTGGAVTITLDSSSPSEKWMSAGTSDVTLGVFRLAGTNENMNLTDFAVKLNNTSSSSPAGLSDISLWDGSTLLSRKTAPTFGGNFSTTNTEAFTLTPGQLTVLANSYKLVTVKGSLASIGTGMPGTSGHLISVATTSTATDYKLLGVSSGSSVSPTASSASASAGVRSLKSVPTIAKTMSSGTLANGTNALYRFTVAAPSAGDIGLYKFTFTVSTTTATATAFKLTETTTGKVVKSNATADANGVVEIIVASADYGATEATVPAGQTYTYELTATITGATATGSSVVTQLEGDATYPELVGHMGTTTTVDAAASNDDDMIWSDVSAATHSTSSSDWTNGYKVNGLPTTNLDQVVLSK